MEKTLTPKSLSCLNHLKHGGTSKSLFIQEENPQEFFALLEGFFLQHQPAYDHDAALVTRAAHDHWILLRRERVCDTQEANLHMRKPNALDWIPADVECLQLFDRYKTEAARAATRSLKNLRTIQKIERDEQRWQLQLEIAKKKLAIQVEQWESLKKQKESTPKSAQEEAEEIAVSFTQDQSVKHDENGPCIPQDVYVCTEQGVTKIFDISPSNEKVAGYIATASECPDGPQRVVRNYIFLGPVPPAYQWLITQNWQRTAQNLELPKSLTFDEWKQLVAKEL